MKVYHKVLILPLLISAFSFGLLILMETEASPQPDSRFLLIGTEWWIRAMFGVFPVWFSGWAIWKAKRNCLILERDMITVNTEGVSHQYRLDEYKCIAVRWNLLWTPRLTLIFSKNDQIIGKHEAPYSRKAVRYLTEELNVQMHTWGMM